MVVYKDNEQKREIEAIKIKYTKDISRLTPIYKDNEIETIKIKYTKDISRLTPINGGDWLDLRCAEETTLKGGEFKYIPLGVAMQLPKGYEAIVAPRSSTFKKFGIIMTNSIGIIDESYCGDNDEWCFPAYAVRDTVIPKDERICQFRIVKHQPVVVLTRVEELGNTDRGGLGSTDKIESEVKGV